MQVSRVSFIPVVPCQPIKPVTENQQPKLTKLVDPLGPQPKQTGLISFGHKWLVKDLWRKGKLPSVVKGIYGDVLTQKNLTAEHIVPLSKGGKTVTSNLALASAANNQARSNKPLKDFADPRTLKEYVDQFIGVKTRLFNGDTYRRDLIRLFKKLGIDITEKTK